MSGLTYYVATRIICGDATWRPTTASSIPCNTAVFNIAESNSQWEGQFYRSAQTSHGQSCICYGNLKKNIVHTFFFHQILYRHEVSTKYILQMLDRYKSKRHNYTNLNRDDILSYIYAKCRCPSLVHPWCMSKIIDLRFLHTCVCLYTYL